jgi:hypothetical protein
VTSWLEQRHEGLRGEFGLTASAPRPRRTFLGRSQTRIRRQRTQPLPVLRHHAQNPTPVRSLATADSWAWVQRAGLCGLHEHLISQRSVPSASPRSPRRTDRRRRHRARSRRRAAPSRRTGPSRRRRCRCPRRIAPPRRNYRIPRRSHLRRPTRHLDAVFPHRPPPPAHPTADRPEVPRILFLVGCEGRGWLARRFGGAGEGGLVLGW